MLSPNQVFDKLKYINVVLRFYKLNNPFIPRRAIKNPKKLVKQVKIHINDTQPIYHQRTFHDWRVSRNPREGNLLVFGVSQTLFI